MTVEGIICLPGPMEEVYREELGERWCFVCRKRVEFVYIVQQEVAPSWYGPNPSIRCADRRHIDGDLFPGGIREWEG